MDKHALIDYLSIVVDLEKNKYIQERTIDKLENEIKQLAIPKEFKRSVVNESYYIEANSRKIHVGWLGLLLGIATGAIVLFTGNIGSCYSVKDLLNITGSLFIRAIIALVAGIIVGCIPMFIGDSVAKSNGKVQAKKIQENYDREYSIAIYNDQLRVQRESAVKEKIIEQRNFLFLQYNNTLQSLSRFYSVGVIYEKYHYNFVAVASFYDYLKSGMCTSLEAQYGRDGAYNIYEQLSRLDKIVVKLDQVIQHLEQIKANQWTIYNAIQDGNALSERLINETNRLAVAAEESAYYNEITAQNSAIAAYSSQQAANELNQIKWLEYSKALFS